MPRIERLEQNTPEWLRWRMEGIGSSDAPVIMGEGAFKTRRLLWAIKTGRARDFAGNPASRRGHALEAMPRAAPTSGSRESRWSRCVLPMTSWSGCARRWTGSASMAPPCSRSSARSTSAIRTPPSRDACRRTTTVNCNTSSRSRVRVEAHYWSFDGRVGRLVRIRPDRDYMKRLVDEEGEFWRRVKENRWPELDDKEVDMSSDPRWRSLALQYRQARSRLDAATEQERKLRIILDRMASARRTFGCGVEVLKSFRRGTVDYAVIPQLSGVDLEKFRKPKIAVTRINLIEANREVSTSAQAPF